MAIIWYPSIETTGSMSDVNKLGGASKLVVDNFKRYAAYIHHRHNPGHNKPSVQAWPHWERVARRMAQRRQVSVGGA